jgi:phosphoribosyl 1,2-cyclic phosphodiesterase
VVLEAGDEPPLILDLGTGLRQFGLRQPADGSFRGTALVTHIHWDHVQGLPFFPPVNRPGARLDIYGPRQKEGPLGEVFGDLMRPPYFPVQYSDLRGDIQFHDVEDEDIEVGSAKIAVRPVPHVGPTVGYRIQWNGLVVTYISDHQQPVVASDGKAPVAGSDIADSVLELCDGADLLIHDSQYTLNEFIERSDWGHCTIEYAVMVAKEAGARRLAMFHHDPAHGDEEMDRLVEGAQCQGASAGVEVFGASEGLSFTL